MTESPPGSSNRAASGAIEFRTAASLLSDRQSALYERLVQQAHASASSASWVWPARPPTPDRRSNHALS